MMQDWHMWRVPDGGFISGTLRPIGVTTSHELVPHFVRLTNGQQGIIYSAFSPIAKGLAMRAVFELSLYSPGPNLERTFEQQQAVMDEAMALAARARCDA